ncbi:MAG TPA: NYN domain-containing protein [Kaistia sp.]|jgi:hypothetical protein|nr:NYN domain-containing protein [Kaistia sp.]
MSEKKLGVLIDAENAQASVLPRLLEEVSKLGVATARRIYGDFTDLQMKSWSAKLLEHSILPVQQFRNTAGKNASDSALIIDAMDLLHSKKFDGFCIVSSDSDFTRLASRIREEGLVVYGFGERKTPQAFVVACDKFIYTEILRPGLDGAPARKEPSATVPVRALRDAEAPIQMIRNAVEESSGDDGWANLGSVGTLISKRAPDFDSRNFGHQKLASFMEALGVFEVERRKPENGSPPIVYVRVRQ